eukprot:g4077.t1
MVSTAFLGASTLLCLFYCYMMIFNVESMVRGYGMSIKFDSEVGRFGKRMAQYLGAAMFVFAFIFGHMIPKPDKHSAAVRTAVMLYAVFFMVAVYSSFLDPAASEMAKAAGMKNVYIMGGFLAFGVFTLVAGMPAAKEHAQ